MDRNELIKLINEKERQFEKNKLKRAALSFPVFFIMNFILLGWIEGFFESMTLSALIDTAFLALVYTVILFFASAIIFGQLVNMSRREEDYIKELNKKLYEIHISEK